MEGGERTRQSRLTRWLSAHLGPRWHIWTSLILVGIVTNFGTAAMRLGAILPSPQPMDFASYYVAGWAVRLGVSPYFWPPDLLDLMRAAHGVAVPTWAPASLPPWVWLMQAFTPVPFPAAAWIWLAIEMALLAWCASMLVRLAGHSGWKVMLVAWALVVTFGPVFLCLTIGQNGILLLPGALLMGRHLGGAGVRACSAVVGWVLAVIAKIFPLVWFALVPFVKRRLAVIMLAAIGLVIGGSWLGQRDLNKEYWFRYLPGREQGLMENVSVDDQSVEAWVTLLAKSNAISFTGKDAEARHARVWRAPWELPARAIRAASLGVVLALAAGVLVVWARGGARRDREGLFYMLVLFSLLTIPHIERYNHTAMLPAMAWLWRQGPRYRSFAASAYCLAGLSRLNHLWALVLPWPLGPIATGTCLYAVIVLGAGIARGLLQTNRLSGNAAR